MNLTKAIITAMKEEAELIIKKFNLKETKSLRNIKIFEWTRSWDDWEENLVLVLWWIWKIQAAIATTYLLENYSVDKIINIWIAGNLTGNDLKVWDVLLPNTFIQQDMYLPFEWSHLDYAKKPIFLEYAIWENYDLQKFWLILNWVCVTGDEFVDKEERISKLRVDFWADICEMEAFSILSVAREYNMLDKCIVIKAISDWADNEAKEAHMNNLEFAMNNSISIFCNFSFSEAIIHYPKYFLDFYLEKKLYGYYFWAGSFLFLWKSNLTISLNYSFYCSYICLFYKKWKKIFDIFCFCFLFVVITLSFDVIFIRSFCKLFWDICNFICFSL